MRLPERSIDLGLLVIRLGLGAGFIWYHGLPKLTGGWERLEATGRAMAHFGVTVAPGWWGLAAALAETLGALLLAAGLFFRPTAFLLTVVMVVAASSHIFTGQGTPAHAFKNAWVFAGLFLTGPGRFSLDRRT
jgi:putative oxidoreductase